jgi:hypothetical protein
MLHDSVGKLNWKRRGTKSELAKLRIAIEAVISKC